MREKALALYFLTVNVLAFVLMGADKLRAVRSRWRVPEAQLFAFPLLGGGPGALLGMFLFRHKLRKRAFRYGLPLLTVLELAGAAWWLF